MPNNRTAYNPEASGLVEHFHRSLYAALISRCDTCDWSYQLSWVLLGVQRTPRDVGDVSPAERVFGQPLHIPVDFLPNRPEQSIKDFRSSAACFKPVPHTYRDKSTRLLTFDLQHCSHIFIKTAASKPSLAPPYGGPYIVLQRRTKSFQLKLSNKPDWVSIASLKPAYLMQDYQMSIDLSRQVAHLACSDLRGEEYCDCPDSGNIPLIQPNSTAPSPTDTLITRSLI